MTRLSRTEAQRAVEDLGWRLILGRFVASVSVDSLPAGAALAQMAVEAAGADADAHLRVDLRADHVGLSVGPEAGGGLTELDVEVARAISAAWRAHDTQPGPTGQALEIAIDALDFRAIKPFWRAVLGYVDEPGTDDDRAIVDPAGQLPTLWFQEMDEPRPQRNRIHFDISVAHDEAERRRADALAAGGHLVSAAEAPAFWILADREGNEICICTWEGRDPA